MSKDKAPLNSAIEFLASTVRDGEQPLEVRFKAAELILQHSGVVVSERSGLDPDSKAVASDPSNLL